MTDSRTYDCRVCGTECEYSYSITSGGYYPYEGPVVDVVTAPPCEGCGRSPSDDEVRALAEAALDADLDTYERS